MKHIRVPAHLIIGKTYYLALPACFLNKLAKHIVFHYVTAVTVILFY